jgi:hypothetical protein
MSTWPALLVVTSLGVAGCVPPEWIEEALLTTPTPVQDSRTLAGTAIAAGAIAVVVPDGWEHTTLQASPDVTIVRPEGVDDSAVQLAIPPGEEFGGELLDWVVSRWRALPYALNNENLQQGDAGAGGRWVMVSAQLLSGIEGTKPVVLQALADGPRVQPLFWYFRDQESLERYESDVDRIAQSVQFLPPQTRAAPRAVELRSLIPPPCMRCAHTFTGAPPATPDYLMGTWRTGTVARHYSGDVPQYADGRLYTFRPDGGYEFSGSMQAMGAGTVVMHESGRYVLDGHRITLERHSGTFNNNGQVKRLEPETTVLQWRPARALGTGGLMLVIRGSSADEWEGYFRR